MKKKFNSGNLIRCKVPKIKRNSGMLFQVTKSVSDILDAKMRLEVRDNVKLCQSRSMNLGVVVIGDRFYVFFPIMYEDEININTVDKIQTYFEGKIVDGKVIITHEYLYPQELPEEYICSKLEYYANWALVIVLLGLSALSIYWTFIGHRWHIGAALMSIILSIPSITTIIKTKYVK